MGFGHPGDGWSGSKCEELTLSICCPLITRSRPLSGHPGRSQRVPLAVMQGYLGGRWYSEGGSGNVVGRGLFDLPPACGPRGACEFQDRRSVSCLMCRRANPVLLRITQAVRTVKKKVHCPLSHRHTCRRECVSTAMRCTILAHLHWPTISHALYEDFLSAPLRSVTKNSASMSGMLPPRMMICKSGCRL